MRLFRAAVALAGLLVAHSASAAGPRADFIPDPASMLRHGPGYRYPQAGWVVLHIEGEPYERGYQHGRLLAHEIADHVKSLASFRSPKAPAEAWRDARLLVNALFQRRYEKEFLEEMKGIADGAAAAGAKFEGRALDLLDIVSINSTIELDFLEANLAATATGLEGMKFREPPYAQKSYQPPAHCSAFAATGPATADGKIVFGHITMFNLYHVRHFNVWLDLKPARGHRVVMQTFPGGIMSGMDYYQNDAGLLVCETTIGQTKFDITGTSMVSRIRQAVQYGASIDDFVKIMAKDNNGVYTNEWLLGDTKTNEIAMFELGTHKHRLWRSSKNEWFGDTPGFYWGCNNTKDLQVRLETLPSVQGKPANVVFAPSPRDRVWLRLYDKHKGKISADFGFEAFTTPPIAAFPSCDAKFTTTALAKDMKAWALFGPPLGRTWEATDEERTRYPDIRPLVSNDWTVLHIKPPPTGKDVAKAVDLLPAPQKESPEDRDDQTNPGKLPAAWHGTLLPKTDADIWLAAAFAEYERIVALEKALKERSKDGKLCEADRDRLAVALFAPWSRWRTAVVRLGKDVPLTETKRELRSDEWYDMAVGKGVLSLAEMRRQMGAEAFEQMMDNFGRTNAGKEVTTAQFRDHAAKASSKTLIPGHPEKENGFWSVYSFAHEPENVLIVYGTRKEKHAQKEAAALLQQKLQRLRSGGISNFTVPIKADTELTVGEMKTRHLLLIGRPETNSVAESCLREVPVKFGLGSFAVRGETYAHPASAVIAAGSNPLTSRYSVVVFAGLSADATRRCVQQLPRSHEGAGAPVVLLRAGTAPRFIVPGGTGGPDSR